MKRYSVFVHWKHKSGILRRRLGLKPLFSYSAARKEVPFEGLAFDALLTEQV